MVIQKQDKKREEDAKVGAKGAGPDEKASSAMRFARDMRQRRKNCPLCTVVQREIEKGNGIPIEEWIYLSHLASVHDMEP
ncbi:MAG: hypothetical protein ACREBS_10085 [Nitrososphaerales archaeon]